MKHLLISTFILVSLTEASAQQYFPIFTQNYANPYLVNPSFLTLDRRPELNATYRQQWVGITDGPKTIQFDLQYPFSPRISVGVNLYNDQSVLLTNSGALVTFGYRVPLASNHILGFGLSAGFVSNQIDLEGVPDLDLIDPVLLNSSNNFDFDGQFGMHYQTGNFTLGLSLLKLVDNRPFSEGSVQHEKFDPFKDKAAIIGYRLNLSDGIFLQPTIYYRSTFTGYEYFEGALLLNYKNTITVGGGYRLDFGPHVMIRMRLKGLHAGYSYDLPSTRYGGSTGGTHEIQVKFQFGKTIDPIQILAKNDSVPPVQEEPVEEDVTEQVARTEEPVVEKPNVEEISTHVPARDNLVDNRVTETADDKVPEPADNRKSDISEHELTGNATYQLVVGAFARKVHADRYLRQLTNQGITAKVITSKTSILYYVIVPEYTTKAITLERVLEIRNNTQFKDAWFKEFD